MKLYNRTVPKDQSRNIRLYGESLQLEAEGNKFPTSEKLEYWIEVINTQGEIVRKQLTNVTTISYRELVYKSKKVVIGSIVAVLQKNEKSLRQMWPGTNIPKLEVRLPALGKVLSLGTARIVEYGIGVAVDGMVVEEVLEYEGAGLEIKNMASEIEVSDVEEEVKLEILK